MQKNVKHYYDNQVQNEWNRLFRDQYHQIEWLVSNHYLKLHLPRKGQILDAGGGPGRYTIALARLGYKMTLFDISPKMLDFATKKIEKARVGNNIEAIIEGTITNLRQFKDSTFDAIISLGAPLSHLVKPSNRQQAIKEIARVAKRGAPIFIGILSRFGAFPKHVMRTAPELIPYLLTYLKMGDRILRKTGETFTNAHYFTVGEIHKLAKENNLSILETVAVESIASGLNHEINALPKKSFKSLINFLIQTSNEPSIAGTSEHLLVVAKKL